ncbi:hypothetical protein C8R43DRAFT_172264 [Mycena crocata]|nr:hypothetical protein C8R43DRAFT_172264 [Mycena crocata]
MEPSTISSSRKRGAAPIDQHAAKRARIASNENDNILFEHGTSTTKGKGKASSFQAPPRRPLEERSSLASTSAGVAGPLAVGRPKPRFVPLRVIGRAVSRSTSSAAVASPPPAVRPDEARRFVAPRVVELAATASSSSPPISSPRLIIASTAPPVFPEEEIQRVAAARLAWRNKMMRMKINKVPSAALNEEVPPAERAHRFVSPCVIGVPIFPSTSSAVARTSPPAARQARRFVAPRVIELAATASSSSASISSPPVISQAKHIVKAWPDLDFFSASPSAARLPPKPAQLVDATVYELAKVKDSTKHTDERMDSAEETTDLYSLPTFTFDIPFPISGPPPPIPKYLSDAYSKARLDCYPEGAAGFTEVLARARTTVEQIRSDAPTKLLALADPTLSTDSPKVCYSRVVELPKTLVTEFRTRVRSHTNFRVQWEDQHRRLFETTWETRNGRIWLIYIGQTQETLKQRHQAGDTGSYWAVVRSVAEQWDDDDVKLLGIPLVSIDHLSQAAANHIELGFMATLGLNRVANLMLLGIGSPMTLRAELYGLAPPFAFPEETVVAVLDRASRPAGADQMRCSTMVDFAHICRVTRAFEGRKIVAADSHYYLRTSNDRRTEVDIVKIRPILEVVLTAKLVLVMGDVAAAVMAECLIFLGVKAEEVIKFKALEYGQSMGLQVENWQIRFFRAPHIGWGRHLGLQSRAHADVYSLIGAIFVLAQAITLTANPPRTIIQKAQQLIKEQRERITKVVSVSRAQGVAGVLHTPNGDISKAVYNKLQWPGSYADWCSEMIYGSNWVGRRSELQAVRDRLAALHAKDPEPYELWDYVGQLTQIAQTDIDPNWFVPSLPKHGALGKPQVMVRFHNRTYHWYSYELKPNTPVRLVVKKKSICLMDEKHNVIDSRGLEDAWATSSLQFIVEIALLRRIITFDDLNRDIRTMFSRK